MTSILSSNLVEVAVFYVSIALTSGLTAQLSTFETPRMCHTHLVISFRAATSIASVEQPSSAACTNHA